MVHINKLSAALAAFSLAGTAIAHPGEVHEPAQVKRELAQRDAVASHYTRGLSKCADSLKARGLKERAIARRAAKAADLRAKRGIDNGHVLYRRNLTNLEQFETVKHNMTGSMTDLSTEALFGGDAKCALTPEDTVGPYYVTGEYMRSNVTEGQAGVPVHLEFQFIDINTCEPAENLLADIWACNSTGVYSGVDSAGEGGLDTTFLRGVQQTDSEGVMAFDTIFPGHYEGRATHEHVVAHQNATLLPNGSYTGGYVSHIGQLFFDESLRSAVEATYPYNTNNITVLSNDDDMWAPSAADNANYDPFPEYIYLNSEDITDGLLMWIAIGIDTSANYTSSATAAAYLASDGGHATGSSIFGKRDAHPHSNAFSKLFEGSAKRWI